MQEDYYIIKQLYQHRNTMFKDATGLRLGWGGEIEWVCVHMVG